MFCVEHEGIVPDVMTLGKGMGGGFPVSGLISTDEIVQAETLESRCESLASEMAAIPPMVLRNVKRSVYKTSKGLEDILETELESRIRCYLSDDLREGLRAFSENRPALFRGS